MNSDDFIEKVKVLNLEKDDVLVLKTFGKLPDQTMRNIWSAVKPIFPNNQVMILEEGMDIGVIHIEKMEVL
jgi:hypothetical protein